MVLPGLADVAWAVPWLWPTDRVQMGAQPYQEALPPRGLGQWERVPGVRSC